MSKVGPTGEVPQTPDVGRASSRSTFGGVIDKLSNEAENQADSIWGITDVLDNNSEILSILNTILEDLGGLSSTILKAGNSNPFLTSSGGMGNLLTTLANSIKQINRIRGALKNSTDPSAQLALKQYNQILKDLQDSINVDGIESYSSSPPKVIVKAVKDALQGIPPNLAELQRALNNLAKNEPGSPKVLNKDLKGWETSINSQVSAAGTVTARLKIRLSVKSNNIKILFQAAVKMTEKQAKTLDAILQKIS